jgi:hypothetical protein
MSWQSGLPFTTSRENHYHPSRIRVHLGETRFNRA